MSNTPSTTKFLKASMPGRRVEGPPPGTAANPTNAASLPADAALTAEMDAFAKAIARPATPSLIGQAFKQGFVELNLGAYIGKVVHKPGNVSAGRSG